MRCDLCVKMKATVLLVVFTFFQVEAGSVGSPCHLKKARPNSCLRTPWKDGCLSNMNVDLILMIERMQRKKFVHAKTFVLDVLKKTHKHDAKSLRLAVFTYGKRTFGVFWPIPKKEWSLQDAIEHLNRVRSPREEPRTAYAMKFAANFPEPSKDPKQPRQRVVVFLGSGQRSQHDEDLKDALNSLKATKTKLMYIQVGRPKERDRQFMSQLKRNATIRGLKRRTNRILWRYLVNVSMKKKAKKGKKT